MLRRDLGEARAPRRVAASFLRALAAALPLVLAARPVRADEPSAARQGEQRGQEVARPDASAPRTELAALPIVAGNSDIGVQIGGAAFLTRVVPGMRPYDWKSDLLLSISLKGGPRGLEIAQHSHDLRFDFPRFLGSPVRLMPGLFVERHVNAGYFGVGNAAPAVPDANGQYGQRYQSITEEVRARFNLRFPLVGPFDGMAGLQVRYTDATAYPGSKLAEDAAAREPDGRPRVLGMDPILSVIPALGVVYDTRDSEITPRSGAFDMIGVRGSLAFPTSSQVRYAAASVTLRRYTPLVGPIVLAGRFIGDVIVGDAPFYDLIQGVTFFPIDLVGSHAGVRGVPNGRYAGKIKLVANVELRSQLAEFQAFGERFRVGMQVFGDVGRVWSDFRFDRARDGASLGLKYGVGTGVYLIWGSAAVVRLDFAYSPDARSANPSLPIGIYAADGQMF